MYKIFSERNSIMQRRNFIQLATMGLASLPLYSFSIGSQQNDELYDVAIVGAGLSGLTAARLLTKAGKRVVVLEAQGRVGGRTWSQQISDMDFIDIGGQWIGKGHESMYGLVHEAGLKTFPTYTRGKSIIRLNGQNKAYTGEVPPLGLPTLLAAQRAFKRFDRASSKIPLLTPWLSENALVMDQKSLANWIDTTISNKKARRLIKQTAEGELCKPAEEVSLLQALSSARATGSFQQAEQVEDGVMRDRIAGGAQGVSLYLFDQMKECVKLNFPVTFVEQLADHLDLGNEHMRVRAKKIIITAPYAVVKKIKFAPALPLAKQLLINTMEMGTVLKIHALYDTPFWRDVQFNGSSMCLDERIELTVDNSVAGSTKGILTSLIHAQRAKQLLGMPDQERKDFVLNSYANLFGEKAHKPIFYHDYSFSKNPWIGGAYTGFYQPGIFSQYGEHISKPCGNIHWAGTETATEFKGFMEGAVRSGERVAKEILMG
jgi:monoamine oxidase